LACGDTSGQVTLWNREKGEGEVWRTDLLWINELACSSSWLACGNTESETIQVYQFSTGSSRSITIPSNNSSRGVQKIIFVEELLYCLNEKELFVWKLEEEDTTGILATPVKVLHPEVAVNDLVQVFPDVLAIRSSDHRVYLWNLQTNSLQQLPIEDGLDTLAVSSVPRREDMLAIATRTPQDTTSPISLELWSSVEQEEWIRIRKVPLDQHSRHLTSIVLMNDHTWITVDTSWDQISVWHKDKCVRSLVGNPTRLEYACHGTYVAWIGRGSTVWLKDIREFY
jgi:WD40 repeat protein